MGHQRDVKSVNSSESVEHKVDAHGSGSQRMKGGKLISGMISFLKIGFGCTWAGSEENQLLVILYEFFWM